ncbi:MAG: hypothetical protein GY816_19695, partial [Cytophagales bacterium]|nr:hypothetical protein [Cytophagales bacterium]
MLTIELIKEKRSPYIGFLEGTLTFLDGSILCFVEFINVKIDVTRYKYSFHYQGSTQSLIFRYDMAPHHPQVKSFPHHKHAANGTVEVSDAPD